MNKRIKKKAIITGGTKGIGYATAELLLKKGFRIFICSREQKRIKKSLEKLKLIDKQNIDGSCCNVGDTESVMNFFKDAEEFLEGLDVLVNNAGIGYKKHIEEISSEDWTNLVSTNLTGVFNCTRFAIPLLKKSKMGHIINIGSRAGRYSYAGGTAYNASKFGLQGFTEALSLDLRKYKLKVSLIAPGTVKTDLTKETKISNSLLPTDVAKVIYDTLTHKAHSNLNWIEMRSIN